MLKFDELFAALIFPVFAFLRFCRGEDVALFEVGDGQVVALVIGQAFAIADDEDAELRAPIAEVIIGDDGVAKRAEDAVDGVADDGGADVADVHLLGGVRRGIIDDNLLACARLGDAALRFGRERRELCGEPFGGDRQVEKAGTRDFDLQFAADIFRDFCRGIAWLEADFFGELERVIALVIAEAGVGRGDNFDRGKVLAGECFFEALTNDVYEFHKESQFDFSGTAR